MIDRKDIEKLAELSRIKMETQEIDAFTAEIDSILDYVGQIKEVAEASASNEILEAGIVRNVFRSDENPHDTPEFSERLLAEAPARQENYFKVKKILGGSDVS